jgi:hypothetical protein
MSFQAAAKIAVRRYQDQLRKEEAEVGKTQTGNHTGSPDSLVEPDQKIDDKSAGDGN